MLLSFCQCLLAEDQRGSLAIAQIELLLLTEENALGFPGGRLRKWGFALNWMLSGSGVIL